MSENRRQAYRCVAEPGTQALLRTGDGEVVVHILNQSANGFGLEFEHEIDLQEGELATLTTTAGQSICRVMHVQFDDLGKTQIGVQRISEISEEPVATSGTTLLAKNLGRGAGSMLLLVAFGLGLGVVMGLTQLHPWMKPNARPTISRPQLPHDPAKRLNALANQFQNLDKLTSLNFANALKLTNGQQRKVEDVVGRLVRDMKLVTVDTSGKSPEQASHMGLLLIRRAWMQVETILTPEQLAQWDAMLENGSREPLLKQAQL